MLFEVSGQEEQVNATTTIEGKRKKKWNEWKNCITSDHFDYNFATFIDDRVASATSNCSVRPQVGWSYSFFQSNPNHSSHFSTVGLPLLFHLNTWLFSTSGSIVCSTTTTCSVLSYWAFSLHFLFYVSVIVNLLIILLDQNRLFEKEL